MSSVPAAPSFLRAQLEVLLGDGHVFLKRKDGGIEHVALEEVGLAVGATTCGLFDERLEEALRRLGLAVVGVQPDQDVVLFREAMGGLGEHDAAVDGVLDVEAGGELTAAGGKLDDAVGFRIGESLEGGVDGDDRRDVYGRIGVVALLGGIEHRGVLLGGCNRHNLMSVTGHLAKRRRIVAGFAAFARAENGRFFKAICAWPSAWP